MTNRRRRIVLLVQSERDDRDMYVEFLRRVGLLPVPVSSATDALCIAPRADLIVTGILLPGRMDGVTLVSRLKENEQTRNIPVIVLSACAWQQERERALAAGCDVFLSKPCLPSVLAREIRRWLPNRAPKAPGTPRAA